MSKMLIFKQELESTFKTRKIILGYLRVMITIIYGSMIWTIDEACIRPLKFHLSELHCTEVELPDIAKIRPYKDHD